MCLCVRASSPFPSRLLNPVKKRVPYATVLPWGAGRRIGKQLRMPLQNLERDLL